MIHSIVQEEIDTFLLIFSKKFDISGPYFDLIHSLDNTLYNTCAKYIKIHILCVVSNVENSEATCFGAPKWDQLFALNSKNLEPQGKQRPHSQRNGFRTLTNVFPPWHGFGCWRAATTNCWEVVSDKLPLFNDAHLTKETTLVNPIHHATRDPKHTKSAGLQIQHAPWSWLAKWAERGLLCWRERLREGGRRRGRVSPPKQPNWFISKLAWVNTAGMSALLQQSGRADGRVVAHAFVSSLLNDTDSVGSWCQSATNKKWCPLLDTLDRWN